MILNPRQFSENHAQIFGALRNFLPDKLFDRQRIRPVVGERTEVVEPICIWHRRQVALALPKLFVIAVQIPEHRLEPDHALAIEHHIHPEDAMRRRMVRPHGDFKQFAFAIGLNHRRPIPAVKFF